MHVFCRFVVWAFINAGIWSAAGNMDDRLAGAALVLRHKLIAFYKANRAARLTEVNDVTVKMLGTHAKKKLKFKAAETFGVLRFLVQQLEEHAGAIASGPQLLEAAAALVSIVDTLDLSGVVIPASDIQKAFDFFKRQCVLTEHIEELLIPKRHMFLHMLHELHFFGNARLYATWKDESLNKSVKKCCKNVSQSTFEASVLADMRQLLRNEMDKASGVKRARF
jgi:hypothetical protein